jgi:hypothetical protein
MLVRNRRLIAVVEESVVAAGSQLFQSGLCSRILTEYGSCGSPGSLEPCQEWEGQKA